MKNIVHDMSQIHWLTPLLSVGGGRSFGDGQQHTLHDYYTISQGVFRCISLIHIHCILMLARSDLNFCNFSVPRGWRC